MNDDALRDLTALEATMDEGPGRLIYLRYQALRASDAYFACMYAHMRKFSGFMDGNGGLTTSGLGAHGGIGKEKRRASCMMSNATNSVGISVDTVPPRLPDGSTTDPPSQQPNQSSSLPVGNQDERVSNLLAMTTRRTEIGKQTAVGTTLFYCLQAQFK